MRSWPSESFSVSPAISTPTRCMRSACCARAASGHDAAPPRSDMNSRPLHVLPQAQVRLTIHARILIRTLRRRGRAVIPKVCRRALAVLKLM